MSRRDTPFGDTVEPHLVSVTCDRCGDGFTTDEGTARRADQNGEQLWCEDCTTAGPEAPPEPRLDEPRVEDVRDDVGTEVGPDAEPPLEATLDDHINFGDITDMDSVAIILERGTKDVATIVVKVHDPEGLYLPVTVHPSLEVLSDEAEDAIVSTLSKSTQLLIDTQ